MAEKVLVPYCYLYNCISLCLRQPYFNFRCAWSDGFIFQYRAVNAYLINYGGVVFIMFDFSILPFQIDLIVRMAATAAIEDS